MLVESLTMRHLFVSLAFIIGGLIIGIIVEKIILVKLKATNSLSQRSEAWPYYGVLWRASTVHYLTYHSSQISLQSFKK